MRSRDYLLRFRSQEEIKMTNHKYRCPVCGAKSFEVTAHVTQDWEIDCNGTFLEALNECVEVTHYMLISRMARSPHWNSVFCDEAECVRSSRGLCRKQ